MKQVYRIDGMHCAGCASAVERKLNSLEGVEAVVSLPAETATIDVAQSDLSFSDLREAVASAGYELSPPVRDPGDALRAERERLERADAALDGARARMRLAWALTVPIMIWMIPEMVFGVRWPNAVAFDAGMTLLALIVAAGPGRATFRGGWRSARGGVPNMDVLIALGAGVSIATGAWAILHALGVAPMIMNYAGIGAMIVAIHLTGRFIEIRARGRASAAIQALLSLEAPTARVEREGAELEVPTADVRLDDIMVIRPGERIPTDGVIVEGRSSLDESLATGESIPVDRAAGDPVIGSTVNHAGVLRVRATGVGADTFLARVIRQVEEAQASKVPIQEFADRVTAIFVPTIVIIASLALVGWLVFPDALASIAARASGLFPWVNHDLGRGSLAVFAAVAVLVIACPCALGLATPTALMVGTGLGATRGVLVRDGAAIQALDSADTLVFDKTGTLTRGRPAVVEVRTVRTGQAEGSGDLPVGNASEMEVLRLAAAVEATSEHPLSRAIVSYADELGVVIPRARGAHAEVGRGVRGELAEGTVRVGNRQLMAEGGIDIGPIETALTDLETGGRTVVLVALETHVLGVIAMADPVRDDAGETLRALRGQGLRTIMLTGDTESTAKAVAEAVGIDDYRARMLPADKVDAIRDLQASGASVAFVGDGINDAPALKIADVGLAVGSGTDIAIEAADVTLVSEDLAAVLRARRLARATFRKIKQNLFWAYFYNVIAIPVAFLGLLHPAIAEAAMALSSVTVVANANRLRFTRL
ncbi:MAG: heavy metal translocating P-type ATPase [Gemmatimonadota bacterium]|nr:heavy metal translocating P-type ATPase [Gemmatimonadota bacterium]